MRRVLNGLTALTLAILLATQSVSVVAAKEESVPVEPKVQEETQKPEEVKQTEVKPEEEIVPEEVEEVVPYEEEIIEQQYPEEEPQREYTREELDALYGEMKQNGTDPVSQSMFSQDMMFFRSMPAEPYWQGNQGNRKFYNGNGELYGGGNSIKVIDISEHQGTIDWQAVKNSGEVDAVIVRIGFGTDRLDYQFNYNISELNRLGIPYGLYLYSYAEHRQHAYEEANFVLSVLRRADVKPTLPTYYDIENWPNSGYLQDGVWHATPNTTAQYLEIIPTFINAVRDAGFPNTYVYSYRSYVEGVLNHPSILKDVSWIAEYGPKLNYNNTHYSGLTGWQYSSGGYIDGINGRVDMNAFYNFEPKPVPVSIKYRTHNRNIGWGELMADEAIGGSTGSALRLEALQLSVEGIPGAHISGRVHVAHNGWMEYANVADKTMGTTGQSKAIEAMQFELHDAPGYKLQYRVHIANLGWLAWTDQGTMAGTTGSATQVEAVQFRLVSSSNYPPAPSFVYQGHSQNVGWNPRQEMGGVIGNAGSGQRLEAFKLALSNGDNISGQVHIQNIGWVPYETVSNGGIVGTHGQALRLEAINLSLNTPGYALRYRTYITGIGWTEWVNQGQVGGSVGKAQTVEAIQMEVYPTNK